MWARGWGGGGRGCGQAPPPVPLLPRGLLTEKAAPVMNIIHSVFSLVLKFRSQLISQPWGPAEHPNFALMQQSYSTFKYYSHFLFKGELSPWAGWATGRPSSRWLTRSPALCPPSPSGDKAGEPRLPAPPGGLPATDQLQQLLPGRLSWRRAGPVTTQTRAKTDAAAHFIQGLHPRSGSHAVPPPWAGKVGGAAALPPLLSVSLGCRVSVRQRQVRS